MYDDQWAYAKPGEFRPSPNPENTKGKKPETDTSPMPLPPALS